MVLRVNAVGLALVNDASLVQQVIAILESDDLLLFKCIVTWASIWHGLRTTICIVTRCIGLRHILRAKLRIYLRWQLVDWAGIATIIFQHRLTRVHRSIERLFAGYIVHITLLLRRHLLGVCGSIHFEVHLLAEGREAGCDLLLLLSSGRWSRLCCLLCWVVAVLWSGS